MSLQQLMVEIMECDRNQRPLLLVLLGVCLQQMSEQIVYSSQAHCARSEIQKLCCTIHEPLEFNGDRI